MLKFVVLWLVVFSVSRADYQDFQELLNTCNKTEVCKLMNQSQPTIDILQEGQTFAKTNIFFTLHSHLDAFWLQSYDQYIEGTGSDGRHAFACTDCMYSGVLESLRLIPSTTYMVAEMCFFKPWFEGLGEADKEYVRQLIKEKRLDIVNGGWVQNDEACANYQDVILQMSVGHRYVWKTFGFIPKISFNIDGFGHSTVQTAVNYLSGMKGQIIERLDTQDIFARTKRHALEFNWNGGPSTINFIDSQTPPNLLTHIRFRRHGPFRYHGNKFAQIKTPGNGFCLQVFSTLKEFERLIYMQRNGSVLERMMFHYGGDDFQYFNQSVYETQNLIVQFYSYFECRSINITWSTATSYFEELTAGVDDSKLEQKYGDFFPYWEDGLYWTAYFTTFPEFKLFVRQASLFQQSASFYLAQNLLNKQKPNEQYTSMQIDQMIMHLLTLREEVALAQHHDGITGTSKYWVHEDVVKRIQSALDVCRKDIEFVTKNIYFNDDSADLLLINNIKRPKGTLTKASAAIVECSLISESKSQCLGQILSVRKLRSKYGQVYDDESFRLLIYNPSSTHQRLVELSLPKSMTQIAVYTFDGQSIKQEVRCWKDDLDCVLIFLVEVPAYSEIILWLRFETPTNPVNHFIKVEALDFESEMIQNEQLLSQGKPIIHEQDFLQVELYSGEDLRIKVNIEKDGIDYQHEFLIDTCPKGQLDHQCLRNFVLSYLFYPNLSNQSWNYWQKKTFFGQPGKYILMNDPANSGLICQFKQVYILERYSELSLPILLKCGKLYSTTLTIYPWNLEQGVDIDTQMFANFLSAQQGDYVMQIIDQELSKSGVQDMYTDTAGWFMMYRENNKREDYEPVYNSSDLINGNMYPMTAYAAITEKPSKNGRFRGNTMVVLTDRAQGVFTTREKSLEIMLEHFGGDDGQGVGETCSKKVDNLYHHRVIFIKEHEFFSKPFCLRCIWNKWQQNLHGQNIRVSDPLPFLGVPRVVPQHLDAPNLRVQLSIEEGQSMMLVVENLQEIVPEANQQQYKETDYSQNDRDIDIDISPLLDNMPEAINALLQLKNEGNTYQTQKTYLNGLIRPQEEQDRTNEDNILRPLEINSFSILRRNDIDQ